MKIIADQNIPFVKECFDSLGEVSLYPGRQITPQVVKNADVLLVRSITPVNEALLAGSRVKFAATATIGMDHIDREWLLQSGIGFASAPGSNANSVAEYVVAAMLALGKKYRFTLEGRRIGIIGAGNVGSKVEAKCRALGMKTVLNDPPLARQSGDGKYRLLEEALECDFLTLHTPLTREGMDPTFHLADMKFFAAIKKGTVFINTARGPVMDTMALKGAMAAGRLGGVVLDVWENEPNVDADLLLKVDLSTPHIAGYSFDGKINGLLMIYRAACRHFGIKPTHTEQDFLPPPTAAEIGIPNEQIRTQPTERIIHDTIQQVYVINRDDFNMREMLIVPQTDRGAFFDRLRREYPIRREFQNTAVKIPAEASAAAQKLKGIGFAVNLVR